MNEIAINITKSKFTFIPVNKAIFLQKIGVSLALISHRKNVWINYYLRFDTTQMELINKSNQNYVLIWLNIIYISTSDLVYLININSGVFAKSLSSTVSQQYNKWNTWTKIYISLGYSFSVWPKLITKNAYIILLFFQLSHTWDISLIEFSIQYDSFRSI